ncbi:hypothetical protein HS088_TW09G00144 [Tripterygium wilfordii]|uniref:Uncharacterized protein n=1 Tax=Tripterygium wilfordii TaxID=458696 RepID=A0A7J7D716_TRIWF|nr:hypothetical protein HS088_TW09G00144 [Tripterygium wilfordii]
MRKKCPKPWETGSSQSWRKNGDNSKDSEHRYGREIKVSACWGGRRRHGNPGEE